MISTIQEIKPLFDAVICHSQNLSEIKSDNILEKWYKAKENIIKLWNGNTIIESPQPVIFDLSPEDKKVRLNDFLSTVSEVYDNEDLCDFLSMNEEDFFANHLSKDYHNGFGIKIPKGTKIVKAFKYFESDKKALNDLQTMASMIIQEDKVRGTLCMSVHPLDFLSSSENTYHWRSCHALDGDYRAGNLSYMLDSSTIICYLKTDDKLCKLPNFPEEVPWNSKKWRMLLFLEDEMAALMAGRQYPFSSTTALDQVMNMFLNFVNRGSRNCWSSWMDDYISEFPRKTYRNTRDRWLVGGRAVMLNGRIYMMEDLVTDAPHSRHFNDLKHSSFYVPMYAYNYYAGDPLLHFSIGSAVPCLYCNETHVERDDAMVCLDCGAVLGEGEDEYYTYCDCCNRRVEREAVRWNNSIDGSVCPDCYKAHCSECENCAEVYYSSEMIYSHERSQYLCPCCDENLKKNNNWKPFTINLNDFFTFD